MSLITAAKSIAKNTGMNGMTRHNYAHSLFASPVDLASSDLKGWSAAAAPAPEPVPLTSIMREQQDVKRKKDRERVQLRDSVWQQVRTFLRLLHFDRH